MDENTVEFWISEYARLYRVVVDLSGELHRYKAALTSIREGARDAQSIAEIALRAQ